ncbi:hypothetical protein [Psychromonas sp. Urea-02u-13]|uniref:hypothetical protein n=1 Tax=Psychromonas sp. Urea-02u-13 TaxID=2058326 RepID=UPI000C34C06D|nr:hypothetical protein [Psychromonas sp. Urea-02u-13]PKG36988.1 hypothetical protein CXF74_21255 [Psychromonas sp. Urea-02u-13]
MSKLISKQLKEIIFQLNLAGLKSESQFLDDALKYSGSSLELYFKVSGSLSEIISNDLLKDDVLKKKIKKCNEDVSKYIQ